MGFKAEPSTSTTVQQNNIPAWIEQAGQQNYQQAQSIAGRPWQPYGGATVAGFSPMQLQAFQFMQESLGLPAAKGPGAMASPPGAKPPVAGATPGNVMGPPKPGASQSYPAGSWGNAATLVNNYNDNGPSWAQPGTPGGDFLASLKPPGSTPATPGAGEAYPLGLLGQGYQNLPSSPLGIKKINGGGEDAMSIFKQLMGPDADATQASSIFRNMAKDIYRPKNDKIEDYLNPYIENVENKALGALDDARVQSLMGNADKAKSARAFGGSRSAIVDAVTNAETAKQGGLLSAGLRKEGWERAGSDRMAEHGNRRADYTTRIGGQDAAARGLLSTAGERRNRLTTAGQGVLASGEQSYNQFLKNFQAMLGIGSTQQNQKQREIDADVAKWNDWRNYDINGLNLKMSTMGMTPYATSSTSTQTSTEGSRGMDPAAMIMGLLSMGMGAF